VSPAGVKALYIFDLNRSNSKIRKLNVILARLALTDRCPDPKLPASLGSSASVSCVTPSQPRPDLSSQKRRHQRTRTCIAERGNVVKSGEDISAEKQRALLAGWQAPDLLGIGVVVCDASCQMLIANQTALDILSARDGLYLTSEGRLFETDETSQILVDVVSRCSRASNTVGMPIRGCFSVAVCRSSGRTPLTVLARPFQSAATVGSNSKILLLLLDFPHVIEDDGIRPLLRLVSAFGNWEENHSNREGVH
jgi:hypothetical protein